jgi:SOS-response transcriptional repressor LexA
MNTQMSRLYEAAQDLKGINGQTALARHLDVSPQTLFNWESRGISKRGLITCQQVLGISASWLECGQGNRSLNESSNVAYSELGQYKIPLISEEQALNWSTTMSAKELQVETYLLNDEPVPAHRFAVTLNGDSMEPRFYAGDRIVIDTKVRPEPGEFVLAKADDSKLLFRKYRPRSTNADGKLVFELMPLNDDFPSMRSDVQEIEIIGIMIEARSSRRR